MKYKMCVWDLDGTLLHTIPTLHYFNNESLKHYGFKQLTFEDSYELIKLPISKYYQRVLELGGCPKDEIDKIVDEFGDYDLDQYLKNCTYLVTKFNGLDETIETISSLGIMNAILSNKPDDVAQQTISTFYPTLLKYAYGQTTKTISKPKVGCVDRLINDSHIKPEEMIIIGDTEVDMLTAINNHIDCVAVTWGYQTLDVLKEYKPNYIINKPQELIEILKEKN